MAARAAQGLLAAGRACREMHDVGIGVAPETTARVFEPIKQVTGADGSTTRHDGGTGLGLAICEWLATLKGTGSGLWLSRGQFAGGTSSSPSDI